jgi:hypothetical protein
MLVKITNPLFVANLAPLVIEFLEKVELKNMNVHSLIATLQRTAQLGGNAAELWAVIDDTDGPIGFAHWHLLDIPYIGTVHLDYIFCKGNRKDIVKELIKEFIAFGDKLNSPWYTWALFNHPKLLSHIKNLALDLGVEFTDQPFTLHIGRRKNNG